MFKLLARLFPTSVLQFEINRREAQKFSAENCTGSGLTFEEFRDLQLLLQAKDKERMKEGWLPSTEASCPFKVGDEVWCQEPCGVVEASLTKSYKIAAIVKGWLQLDSSSDRLFAPKHFRLVPDESKPTGCRFKVGDLVLCVDAKYITAEEPLRLHETYVVLDRDIYKDQIKIADSNIFYFSGRFILASESEHQVFLSGQYVRCTKADRDCHLGHRYLIQTVTDNGCLIINDRAYSPEFFSHEDS